MRLTFRYRNLAYLAAYSVMLVIAAIFSVEPFSGLDFAYSFLYLAISLVAVLLHIGAHRDKNWLRTDTVFLLGFFIVHYQWLAMILLSGIFPEATVFLRPVETHATYGAWLSTLALLAWLAGFIAANPRVSNRADSVRNGRPVLIFALLIFGAFAVAVGPSYFTAELYRTIQDNFYQTVTGIAGYLFTLTEILILVLIAMYYYPRIASRAFADNWQGARLKAAAFSHGSRTALLLYFILYCLAFLFAGERGNVVQLLAALGVIYASHYRPIRLVEFIFLASLGALALTIVGVVRSSGGALSVNSVVGEFGLWGVTKNLAASSITLYQGIDLVHTGGGYYFGQLWLSQLLGVIPFLQGAYLSMAGLDITDISSSSRITQYIVGPNPHTGYGTSFVIDIYLNFGWPGVLFLSFLFGIFTKFVSKWLGGSAGFTRFFVSVVAISYIFYVPRSSLLFPLRSVVWGLLIIMAFSVIGKSVYFHGRMRTA